MRDLPLPPDPQGAEHIPVLLDEVLAELKVRPGSSIIDATLGGGGHTAPILEHSKPDGRVLGLDADPAAVRRVTQRLHTAVTTGRLDIVQTPFEQIGQVAVDHGFTAVDGILIDLGVSSFQLETADRGFSFLQDGPLDMRFDLDQVLTAHEIVNTWDEVELADIIYRYGEEHRSRRIARQIVAQRPLDSTAELAAVVERAVGGRRGKRIHPATQTFQALRIAVNRELSQLEQVLPQCLALLKTGGRLAVISFHSLEDRIVKQWMQQEASDWVRDEYSLYGGHTRRPTIQLVTRRPITAGEVERQANPRSRSAKLRVAEKLDSDETDD